MKMPTTSWTIAAAEPPTAARASEPRAAHHDGIDGAVKLLKERACGDEER
ncbi:MAG: hypothetical protein ACLUNZ_07235 [Evtepia sp.]